MFPVDRLPDSPRRGWIDDPSRLAEALVGGASRQCWLVVAVFAVLTLIGVYVCATRFAITTETDQLLQSDSALHRDKVAFEAAFPHLTKVILTVIDGTTPGAADAAAAMLTDALQAAPGPAIRKAWRPDGGTFFNQNGLLLLPQGELKTTLDGMLAQQPTLVALSGDPSLRGLLRLLQIGAGRGALEANAGLVAGFASVVELVLAGKPAALSWEGLMSGQKADPARLRRFVLVEPILDYKAIQPAAAATGRIRAAATELGLTPERGVKVRLTGLAPLADEEFATVKDGAPLHLGLTIVAIAVILYLALKSGKVIFAVLATTLVGLIITIGAGLLMVGRFNVISVAVAALFMGLGVDFGIQVAVRYRDERFKLDDVGKAILRAARGIGWSLTLAAVSLVAGFFAFLPTSFRGVSELGLITGVGMIIAFFASLTLLPALLTLLNPPGERETVETPALAAIDHWIHAHRRAVIIASALIVLAGLPFLFRLEFDANPMHLRSEETEAVATFLDLTRQPGMTPNTISVLAPSVGDAKTLSAKLSALPEVGRVVSIATFSPDDQADKLALIRQTAGSVRRDRQSAPAGSCADRRRTRGGDARNGGHLARRGRQGICQD